jgi:hypothetical protein
MNKNLQTFALIYLLIFSFGSFIYQQNENKNYESQIKELQILFNQKFLQEMVTNKPSLRELEYKNFNRTNNLTRFEI